MSRISGHFPFPLTLSREVWVRTQTGAAFHRFRLFGRDFCEVTMIDREGRFSRYEPETSDSDKDGNSRKDDLK